MPVSSVVKWILLGEAMMLFVVVAVRHSWKLEVVACDRVEMRLLVNVLAELVAGKLLNENMCVFIDPLRSVQATYTADIYLMHIITLPLEMTYLE